MKVFVFLATGSFAVCPCQQRLLGHKRGQAFIECLQPDPPDSWDNQTQPLGESAESPLEPSVEGSLKTNDKALEVVKESIRDASENPSADAASETQRHEASAIAERADARRARSSEST